MSLALVGCKAPPAHVTTMGPAPKPEPRRGTVETGRVEYTRYTDPPHRRKAWTLEFKDAKFNVAEGFRPGGSIENPDAKIYEDDSSVSTVHADRGVAESTSPNLRLEGNVIAKSARRDARLKCKALLWDPNRRILIATGNVQYQGASMEVGPFPEIWASPDLERFGTPDMFTKDGAVLK